MKNIFLKIVLFSLVISFFVFLTACNTSTQPSQNNITDDTNEEVNKVEEQINNSSTPGFFSNKEFGISFEYPKEWELNEINHNIRKPIDGVKWFDINNRTPEPGRAPYLREGEILIDFYYYTTDLEVEEWFTKYDNFTDNNLDDYIESKFAITGIELNKEDMNISLEEITKNGFTFKISSADIPLAEEGGPIKTKSCYFKKDGNIFVISAVTPLDESAQEQIDTFDEIINSLDFIE
jgi:hypothetical protein